MAHIDAGKTTLTERNSCIIQVEITISRIGDTYAQGAMASKLLRTWTDGMWQVQQPERITITSAANMSLDLKRMLTGLGQVFHYK